MPIHFGYAVSSSQKPSTALRLRGLNLVRAAPSQVKISFVPDAIVLAYYLFATILSSFLISLAQQATLQPHQCQRIPPLPHTVHLSLPPLAVQITDNNPAMVASFQALGFESQTVRGRTLLLKEHPTIADFKTIMSNPSINRKCFAPWKYVNTEGMMTFLTMRKVVTLFLELTISPAFNTTTHNVDTFLGKTSTSRTPLVPTAESSTSTSTSLTTSYKWTFERISGSNLLSSDPGAFVAAGNLSYPPTRNYGSLVAVTSRIPLDQSGVFIPYVAELSREDDSGPVEFIRRHAFTCLGNSYSQCFAELEQIRRGWGLLKTTTVGHQLSHIFKCFELTLEGQATVGLMISSRGRYDGCVIVGSGFTILTEGQQSRPLKHEELTREIREYGSHDRAVEEICALMEDPDEVRKHFPKSMASLRKYLLGATLSENHRSVIMRFSPFLDFEEESWGVNPSTLEKFLEICATGELPKDTPITSMALLEPNVALAALSSFGFSSCPSFRVSGGRSLDLRGKMPAPKMEIQPNKGKNKRMAEISIDDFEQTVQVQLVSYRQACTDYVEMTIDGKIKVMPVGNASENVRIYRGAVRGALWNSLAKVVHNSSSGGGASEDTVIATTTTGLSGSGVIRKDDTERDLDAYL